MEGEKGVLGWSSSFLSRSEFFFFFLISYLLYILRIRFGIFYYYSVFFPFFFFFSFYLIEMEDWGFIGWGDGGFQGYIRCR